jgi:hypothetical protein
MPTAWADIEQIQRLHTPMSSVESALKSRAAVLDLPVRSAQRMTGPLAACYCPRRQIEIRPGPRGYK